MKQQINLYQLEKKKWGIDLTFQVMMRPFFAFLGILLLITIVSTIKHIAVKKQLSELGKTQMEKTRKLQTITSQLPEERTREQIIDEIKKYENEKKEKQEVLALLSVKIDATRGFSGYLEALAQKTISGLWFTKLNFEAGGNLISLEGHALKPEYLPNLLARLRDTPAFSGKTFEVFKESLNDKTRQIDFILETQLVEHP